METQGVGVGVEPVVLINMFEVEKADEDDFLVHWHRNADYMKQQDGYISHRFHQSLDPGARFRYVNVAVFQSPQQFKTAVESPTFRQLVASTPGKPTAGLYRVIAEAQKPN